MHVWTSTLKLGSGVQAAAADIGLTSAKHPKVSLSSAIILFKLTHQSHIEYLLSFFSYYTNGKAASCW